jgi:GntR family phosphonate transport system transcriptional regulator
MTARRQGRPLRKLVRQAGEAVWSQIERELARDIERGAIRPGGRLATEHELAARFGVNRHTVRQALASLVAKGLVQVEHGRGTFVADFAIAYALGRRTRFSENLAAAGLEGRRRLLGAGEERAGGVVASGLKLAARAWVVRLETVAESSGRPVAYSEHYFPAQRFAGIARAVEEAGSITRALRRFGVSDFTRKVSHITARLPEERVAALIGQPVGRPVLCVEGVNVDARGRPIEFGRAQFAGDLVQLTVEPGR